MEIVPSTLIALAAIAVLLRTGPRRGVWLFFALSPLGAAAAFNMPAVGGASFGLKEFAVILFFALVCATARGPDHLIGTLRPGQPGFWLALLAIFCVFSAYWAPRIFAGETIVFSISRNSNGDGIITNPLYPSAGNITQLFSFTISVLAFLCFATLVRLGLRPETVLKGVIIATSVHVGLGLLDVASAAVGAPWLLEPIRTANYSILDDHHMMGMKRMIGGFPEASSFGAFSMGLFAFWVHQVLTGRATKTAVAMLVLSLFAVLRSTSSGAYVALVLFLGFYGAYLVVTHTRGLVSRKIAGSVFGGVMLAWFCALMLFAAYEMVDPVTAYLDETIFDKLDSQSGVERMSWNAQAFQNFVDTSLIGAGLGSVRGSNWFMACLGNIGLPGTILFIVFLGSVMMARLKDPDPTTGNIVASLKIACFGLFLADFLIAASPNFGAFFFALAGLATGLARATVLAPSTPNAALKAA